ncbi:sigma factor-like helix-turn-helix DNA-binding protein [Ileibacterium valens]|uniref:sigma factor-like helix-turn-helix DNA-binding protein n=1 Tax=Ileibacterium valens TaxID=1862668 RepID=UPI00272CC45E|nr:sigma factor-like helix-turn-helix DNA-binding protein [Ileibacterium valens]
MNKTLPSGRAAMDERLRANDLFDVYGSLLTKRQQEILTLYVLDDLSLSEIQEELQISRAAISEAIRKGIASMEQMERSIGFIAKRDAIINLFEMDESSLKKIRTIYFEENAQDELIRFSEN